MRLIPVFLFLQLLAFGQQDQSVVYTVRTLFTVNDSTYVVLERRDNGILTEEVSMIYLKEQVQPVVHGAARFWYGNGQPKAQGAYIYGARMGVWEFWDENGTSSKVTDPDDIHIRGCRSCYYYIDGVKVYVGGEE